MIYIYKITFLIIGFTFCNSLVAQSYPIDTFFYQNYSVIIYKEDFQMTGQKVLVSYRIDTLKSNKVNWVRLTDTLFTGNKQTYTSRVYLYNIEEIYSFIQDVSFNFDSKSPGISYVDFLFKNNGIECLRLAFYQQDTSLSLISISKRDSMNFKFIKDYVNIPLNRGSGIGSMNTLRGENTIYKLYFDEKNKVNGIECIFLLRNVSIKIFFSSNISINKIERYDYKSNRKKVFNYLKIPFLDSIEEYLFINNEYIKDGCFYYYNRNSGKIINTLKYKEGKLQ